MLDLTESGAEDFFIGCCRFDGDQGHPLALAYVVVLVCQQGSAELEVNFQPYKVMENDFLVLAEDSIAWFRRRSDDFACRCYLLNRAIAAEVAAALPNSLFAFLNRSPLLCANRQFQAFLQAWENQASIIQEQGADYRRTMLVNHFQNLFLWLCASVDLQSVTRNDFSRPEALCWRFWELIAVHCGQQREVAFYADLLHVTPYYLAQLSRKYFNDTPKTLIDRQVVLEIKKQLAQPRKAVQRIAEELNFADASYLGKYFKRHTGLGLSQYRRG
ncbi:helix-turn-helix domain-containing protein [Pseudomonas sp. MC042]|uniref:Helix-turn-helix domain-containing protein n=1 Tax=Pseudomonas piscis TaxID=2614538 RepID=A0A7X1PL12_9PSED|nr:helix-turn-helix domain-containing protein [Pseudomonas piscis]